MPAKNLIVLTFLLLIEMFSLALIFSSEYYLMEFNSLSPQEILIYEGFFGLIFSFSQLMTDTPIEKLKKVYNETSIGLFILFIILLIIYAILSGLFNIYRLYTNKSYSPMAVTLANYFLNPFFMIYYYSSGDDFLIKGEKNILYFIINFFLAIIIALTGLIFNDFLVFYCCGLERDTYENISKRSENYEYEKLNELSYILKDDESESESENDGNVIYKIYV